MVIPIDMIETCKSAEKSPEKAGLQCHVAMLETKWQPTRIMPSAFFGVLCQGIVISAEVQKALREGEPVVALESTIISHGMPYPQNLRTAIEVEAVVRANGATPATIAIIQGVPHVGLTQEELHLIAEECVQRATPSFCFFCAVWYSSGPLLRM